MPITSEHPEYRKQKNKWELVRAIINNDAKKFLHPFENTSIYQQRIYREYALLVNFTNLTKVGLTGLVFRKDGEVSLPSELNYLLDDVTGTGLNLDQFGQFSIGETLQTGRLLFLADFPRRDGVVSVLDQDRLGLNARIVPYPAESVRNWQTKRVGSKTILTKLVLEELRDELGKDGFEWMQKRYYRVLSFNAAGQYTQAVLDEHEEIIEEPRVVVDGQGNPFREITVAIAGSSNNDWVLDHPPLYDMARLNLQHYRNSADLEESIRIHGQATAVMTGELDIESFKQHYGDTLAFGASKLYYLQGQGSVDLVQAGANTLVSAEMKRKEEQAAAIGARLIAPPGGRETAEAARIRYGSQNSALFTLTSNVSKAMTKALKFCAQFMNAPDENIVYELNRKFYDEKVDPNLLAMMKEMLSPEVLSKNDVRQYLRDTNVLSEQRTDSNIESDIRKNPIPERDDDNGVEDAQTPEG